MRKLIIFLVPVLFTMCINPNVNKNQIQLRSDSLQRLVNQKDSALYAFMGTINDIENNLQEIKAKENIITLNATEAGANQNQAVQINEDINFIYDLMLENKNRINELENQLKQAGVNKKELQRTIKNLQIKLQQKDAEILQLREELRTMNIKVDEMAYKIDTLQFDNQVKQAIIDAQDTQLNTAYYLFGSAKELKTAGVIDKKGSFIGNKKLNSNFDKTLFTQIDIRENIEFNINTQKIKILTNHPASSYQTIGEKPIEKLEINNPDEFWSVSKYLVIILD